MEFYSVFLLHIVLGCVYCNMEASIQLSDHEGCKEYIEKFKNSSEPMSEIYTNIISVEEGTNLSFVCRNCWNRSRTSGDKEYCWYSDRIHLTEKDKPFTVIGTEINSENFGILSKLIFTANSETHNSHTFFCEDRSDCTKKLLPICFNSTVSHIIVVQVGRKPSVTLSSGQSTSALTDTIHPTRSIGDCTSILFFPTDFRSTATETTHSALGSYEVALWTILPTMVLTTISVLLVIAVILIVRKRKSQVLSEHTTHDHYQYSNPMNGSLGETTHQQRSMEIFGNKVP